MPHARTCPFHLGRIPIQQIPLTEDAVGAADWGVSMLTFKTVFGVFGSNLSCLSGFKMFKIFGRGECKHNWECRREPATGLDNRLHLLRSKYRPVEKKALTLILALKRHSAQRLGWPTDGQNRRRWHGGLSYVDTIVTIIF